MPTYTGTGGPDSYWGGPEADRIEGLGGSDYLLGNGGDDEIFGGDGNDTLHGGTGNDLIEGGEGNDGLQGNEGTDILRGQNGDDRLLVLSLPAGDLFDGGDGFDTLQFDAGGSTALNFSISDPSVAQNLYGATVINVERLSFRSGSGDDQITGGALNDYINGWTGNDWIDGGLGDDTLNGDLGTDTLYGGEGNDTLRGDGTGAYGLPGDTLYGGAGDDQLYWSGDALIDGGTGDDLIRIPQGGGWNQVTIDLSNPDVETVFQGTRITGVERLIISSGSGDDQITGGVGDDAVDAAGGDDTLNGGSGDDTLAGGDGADQLFGGAGDDVLSNYTHDIALHDFFDGGAGFDTLYFWAAEVTAAITIDLQATTGFVLNVEKIDFTGGRGANFVSGGIADDIFRGTVFGGDNHFDGRGGDDYMSTEGSDDVLSGGDGNDFINAGLGANLIYGGNGDDNLSGSGLIDGGAGNDELSGNGGADVLLGGDGDDFISGRGGTDSLIGGMGNDTYTFSIGDQASEILELAGEGVDTISLFSDFDFFSLADFANVENLVGYLASNGGTLIGNELDNVIVGTLGADVIVGGAGADHLLGQYGSDTLDGGAGYDTALFNSYFRASTVTVGASVSISGPDGDDTATGVERFSFSDGDLIVDPGSVGAQVMRLYSVVFDREVDAIGLDYWVDQVEDKGLSLGQVADFLASSPEFQSLTGGLTNAQFVDYVYEHALGRAPDADGRAYWIAKLDGGTPPGDMLVGFSESAEHKALTADMVSVGYFQTDDVYQAITLFYDSFADRLPDRDGLTYWGELVNSGATTLDQVAGGFAGSVEFQQRTAGMNNGQLVDFMYENTLDRLPDAEGRQFWVNHLDSGAVTLGQLLYGFSQSAEHAMLMAPQIVGGIDYFA